MLKDKQAVSNLQKLDQHSGHNPVELSRWRALGFGVLAYVECGDSGVDGDAFFRASRHVQKVLLLDMSPIRVSITGEAGRIQNRGGVPCVEAVLPWKPPRGIWPHELNSFDDDRLMVAPGNIEKGVLARAVGSRDRNQLYRIVSYVVNAVAEG